MAILDKINAFTGEHSETIEDSLKNLSEIKKLPEVTAEDNGKVLSVVEGEWAKAEIGPDSPDYEFICNIKREVNYDEAIDDYVETWTSDKTYEELYTAIDNNELFLIKYEDWEDGYLNYSEDFLSSKATSNFIKEGLIFNKDYVSASSNIRHREQVPDIVAVSGTLVRLHVYSDGTFEFNPYGYASNAVQYMVTATKNGNTWTIDHEAYVLFYDLTYMGINVLVSFNDKTMYYAKGHIIASGADSTAAAENKYYRFVVYHPINGAMTFEASGNDDYPTCTES